MNNTVFKCFLKVGREPLSLSWARNEFHTVGAATEKAPYLAVFGTALVQTDLRGNGSPLEFFLKFF